MYLSAEGRPFLARNGISSFDPSAEAGEMLENALAGSNPRVRA
jgi:hypothetical protein